MFQQCYSKLLPHGVISVELYFYSIVSVMRVPVSSDEKVAFPIRLKRAALTGFEMAGKGILFLKSWYCVHLFTSVQFVGVVQYNLLTK